MRVILSACLLFPFLILIGCGGGGSGGDGVNPPPPGNEKSEWTVMVYMGGDNNLAPAAIDDIQELEQIGSTDKVNFTVLADVYYEQQKFTGGYEITTIYDKDDNPVVPMMQITKHPEEGIQSHLVDAKAVLKPIDGFNSANPPALTNFITWSAQRFPAKKYDLILWNHGSSWTPGRETNAVISDSYEANGEAMNISEVKLAIQNSGIHFNLIEFDACNMASIEVMYELREVTDYFCASQKAEPGNGNDYSALASSLTSNPTSTAEQLGRYSVDSFINSYVTSGKYSVTRSLIKSSTLQPLAATISDLATSLTNPALTTNTELLGRLYEPIRFFQDVDLKNLLDVLSIYYPSLSVNINNAKNALANVIIYSRSFTGSGQNPGWSFGTRQFGQGEDIAVNGVSGVNIYLPMQRDFTEDNVSLYSGMDFNYASHWYDVIHYIYWGTSFGPTAPAGWWAGLVWDTNVDLDLWIFEPDGYGGIVSASPSLGATSINGSLSSDSFWTGDSFESYISKPQVQTGPYFFLAVYSGPDLFSNSANCMLALGYTLDDENPICSDVSYISEFAPDDPDFGQGVVYFGFIIYNPADDNWYYLWDDRSGDAIRGNQFSVIRDGIAKRNGSSKSIKIQPPVGISDQAIEKYHQQGLELARKLSEQKQNAK